MNKILYYVLMMNLISATALANPLPVGGPGKTIVPYLFKPTSISLVEEKIFIKVNEKKEIPGFIRGEKMTVKFINYDCTYYLKNSDNKDIKLNVGFPFYDGHTSVADTYGAIEDFQVFADSKEIKPVLRHSHTRGGNIILKEKLEGTVDFKLVDLLVKKNLVKEMPWQPDMYDFSAMGLAKKEVIRNFNRIDFGKKNKEQLAKIILENLGNHEDVFKAYKNWYYFPVPFKADGITTLHITYNSMNGNYDYKPFYYVLKTGRYWKGNIGKCIVTVDFGKDDSLRNYKINPKNYKIFGPNSIQFIWENFVPKEDIFIGTVRNSR
jgi:hypothetical protein